MPKRVQSLNQVATKFAARFFSPQFFDGKLKKRHAVQKHQKGKGGLSFDFLETVVDRSRVFL